MRRTDPANAELARAEMILTAAFPVSLDSPADLVALIKKLG